MNVDDTLRRVAVAVLLSGTVLSLAGCREPSSTRVDPDRSPSSTQSPAGPTSRPFTATATAVGPSASDLDALITQGRATVETWFGEPFSKPFDVKVLSNRAALTEFARQRFGMEKTECWMVAMGVSSVMVVLSPNAWKTEACEHDPTAQHIREIVTHELVHVFHGQHNPSHEFDGMDDAGWFVEGLAFHVAGQLTDERVSRLRTAVTEQRTPKRLADAWSGELRYATSGSLVQFVERNWGRDTLKRLLPATSNAELLAALNMTEDELLVAWRKSLTDTGEADNPR